MTKQPKDADADIHLTEALKMLGELQDIDAPNRVVAQHYFKKNTGALHLSWVLDNYFGLVAQHLLYPASNLIHAALVERGHTEDNPLHCWGDHHLFHIPCKGKSVFVHTGQSRDFLYILNRPDDQDDYGKSFHIRRIYRQIDADYHNKAEILASLEGAVNNADDLMEHHDDTYRYSRRPSLEAYRKIGFQIPYHPVDREKERDHYGDFRDGGYVLSYEHSLSKYTGPKVEGCKYVFTELELISGCYMPGYLEALEIKESFPKFESG